MDNQESTIPGNRGNTGRNPDGTFMPGFSGNLNGRPKNTLKEYVKGKFIKMSDKEKEEFLTKISPEVSWKMGEGNPDNSGTIEHTIPQNLIDLIKSVQKID